MPVPFSRFRLGLCLALVGGLASVVAYATWSSLMADLNRTCWSSTPASSCTSVALSAGFWLHALIGSLVLLGAGVLLAIVSRGQAGHARLPAAP